MNKIPSGRALAAFLGIGGLLSLAYFMTGSPADGLLYAIIPGLSAAVIFVRTRKMARRLPWQLVAAGLLSSCAAETAWLYYEATSGVPWPSFAHVFYIASYPLVAAGLVIFIRDRNPGRDWSSLIDASIITVGVGFLLWYAFVDPYVSDGTLPLVELVISTAYPLMDVLLLAVIARIIVGGGLRNAALGMLLAGTVATLLGDCVFAWQEFTTGYSKGAVDAAWLAQYLLWGAAALHPSAGSSSDRFEGRTERLSGTRLVALGTSSLLPTGFLFVAWIGGGGADLVLGTTIATVLLFTLVVVRMVMLHGRIQQQVHRLSKQESRLRQILEEREILAQKLHHQAYHDTLTGLPNRALFMKVLQEKLASRIDRERGIAVFFLDLDNLKAVNDSMGHASGDELLVALSNLIKNTLRHGDFAARLGGDEFGMIIHDVTTQDEARCVARRLFAVLRSPVSVRGTELEVLASVGVSLVTDEVQRAEDLLHNADSAMYLAKRRGKDRFEIFDAA